MEVIESMSRRAEATGCVSGGENVWLLDLSREKEVIPL